MNSLTALAVLLPLVLALLAAPAALLAGAVKPRYAAPVGAVFAALAALATLWVWGVGGAVDVPWSPTYDLRFTVELDGLAVLYALLATEIDFAELTDNVNALLAEIEQCTVGEVLERYPASQGVASVVGLLTLAATQGTAADGIETVRWQGADEVARAADIPTYRFTGRLL